MNRSEFLRLLGLGSASLLLAGMGQERPAMAARRVIVLGAGIAGLGAARMLRDAGHEVVVVEARDRIGGRIWTNNSLGTPIDLGASWIYDGKANPLTPMLSKYSVAFKPTDRGSYLFFRGDGSMMIEGDRADSLSQVQKLFKKINKAAAKSALGTSMAQLIEGMVKVDELDETRRSTLEWQLALLEISAGCSLSELTAAPQPSLLATGDLLMTTGFGKLLDKMAVGLDIRLGQRALVVRQGESGVTVSTSGEDFEGDFALVTLPLGVLKAGDLRFDPVLSTSKKNALKKLGIANVNKMALRFDKPFWPNDREFFGYNSKRHGEFPVFLNWAKATNKPYLIATIGTAFSNEIARYDEMDLAMLSHQTLYRMFEKAVPPNKVLVSDWAGERFSKGAFSYLPAGVEIVNRDYLAQPEKRVFFAGEHTIRAGAGTAHGAYNSGVRAAQWIMER